MNSTKLTVGETTSGTNFSPRTTVRKESMGMACKGSSCRRSTMENYGSTHGKNPVISPVSASVATSSRRSNTEAIESPNSNRNKKSIFDFDLYREMHRLFKEPKKTNAERTRSYRQRKKELSIIIPVVKDRNQKESEFAMARSFRRLFKEPAKSGGQRMKEMRQRRNPYITSTFEREHKRHLHYTSGCTACRRRLDKMPKNALQARAYEPGFQVLQKCDERNSRAFALAIYGKSISLLSNYRDWCRPLPEQYMMFQTLNGTGVKRSRPLPVTAPHPKPKQPTQVIDVLPEVVDHRPKKMGRISRVTDADMLTIASLREKSVRLARKLGNVKEYAIRKRAEHNRKHPLTKLRTQIYRQMIKDENLLDGDDNSDDEYVCMTTIEQVLSDSDVEM